MEGKMNMKKFKRSALTTAIISACFCGQTLAGETIEFENGADLDWRVVANYATGMRTEDQDPNLTSSGNANFEKNDLIANGLSLLFETKLRKDNYGLVMSATGFSDNVYQDDKYSEAAEKYHGGYARLLDLYVYTTFAFGESGYADIRLGKHVVSWGEGLFFPSISLAQGPSDAIKATTPGAEVKDILLPEDQLSMQLEITPNLSLLAHYQYNWHATTVPEPGSFWSAGETTGRGAYCIAPFPGAPNDCGFGLRGEDITPQESGQWGVGARYRISDNTEFGLYYLNYSDRIPLPDIYPSAPPFFIGSDYQIRYADKIDLIGATFTTTTGMNSFAGEISYKDGAPILVNTAVVTPSTSKVLQTSINAITNFGRTSFADVVTLVSELSYVDILDVEARDIKDFPAEFMTASDSPYWSSHGLAFASSLSLAYPGTTENWDLGVSASYQNQISGRTLTGGLSGSAGEGEQRVGLGVDFTHPRTGIQVSLKYAAYLGDTYSAEELAADPSRILEASNVADRDNLSLSFKYAF
jgi:Protein of unknown function (DUF1302)